MALRDDSPNGSDDGTASIPSVIFVKTETLLCRWDAARERVEEQMSPTEDDECIQCLPSPSKRTEVAQNEPPKLPTRRASPPAQKERQGSLMSGVSILDIVLRQVDFTNSAVPMASCPLSNLLKLQHVGGDENKATVVFCIRRAGCGSCRDHGLSLARLCRSLDFSFDLFGIVNSERDAGLEEFYQDYFPFPIYKDENKDAFRFLGNRKLSVWQLLKGHKRLAPMYKHKGIKNIPFGGDLFTQGGVLLFDRGGSLKYIYYEQYGDELDMDALTWAVRNCAQKGTRSSSKTDTAARLPTRTTGVQFNT